MNALWVLPSIDPTFRDECIATLDKSITYMIVDNSVRNHGVAASWNLGVDSVLGCDVIDYLVLLSESVRFGKPGGLDFERALNGASCAARMHVRESNDRRGIGFHLVALHRDTLKRVGRFDEIFWPAWWEDSDYRWRMSLAGLREPEGVMIDVDAELIALEHSYASGLVAPYDFGTTSPLFEAKWGGRPGIGMWEHPYNDSTKDWSCVSD